MISELFKTNERIQILNYVLYNEESSVTKISKETGVSKGLVSRFLKYLEISSIIEKMGLKYRPENNAKTKAIKILLNLDKINLNLDNLAWAETIGIYGSWASGTNTYESDLDVFVRVNEYPSEYEISKLNKDLKDKTMNEINILVLTPEKLNKLKNTDKPFYNSLLINSIILKGESLEST